MLQISIKDSIEDVKKQLGRIPEGMDVEFAKALTFTGERVKKAERGAIVGAFDRPTPRTKNSVYLKWATPKNLQAIVWIVEDAAKGTAPIKYLMPEIEGGGRNHTRFERALQRAGFLYPGEYVVPSKYAKRNRYGNITPGTYTRVLSQLRASPDPSQNRTDSRRSKKSRATSYFLVRTGKGRGIWERRGKAVKPLFIFTSKKPTYRRRFDFYGVARKTTLRNLDKQIARAIERAIRKAGVR